jgi:hypothetical protein
MFAEAFHSMIKGIHHALVVMTSFGNSMSMASLEEEKRRNLHTKSYKEKLERLHSVRLTHCDQAARLLDMQRLQVVKDT